MRMNRLRLALFLPALGVLCIGALVLLRSSTIEASSPAVPKRTLAVQDVPIEFLPSYRAREIYNGRVVSRRSSELGFTSGGRLQDVSVDEGDHVEAGQLLARVDASKLQAARREIEAQLAEIDARLSLAKLTQNRTATLADKDSISEQRYDEARFEVMALRARQQAAKAGIEAIDVDLAHAEIRAPYRGSITRRSIHEGTIVAPGQEVLRIIEADAWEARFGVPPATADRLTLGGRHALTVGPHRVEATLQALMDEVASDTRTVTAIFSVTAPALAIRHGALATLDLEVEHESPGFWLPITALAESRRGLWSAYALVRDESSLDLYRLERRELQLIHIESDRAYLRGTLQDGERVVAGGLHRLVPDQQVRLATDKWKEASR